MFFPDRTEATALPGRRDGWVALALPLALIVVITALRTWWSVDSDVAWQLWIAGRMHAGANLYRDIIETNPPLWFWMAVPVDRVAALLGWRVEAVPAMAVGLLGFGALAATNALLAQRLPPQRRALLLGYGALALMAMPWVHLGQREQIALIGTVPYAALIAVRRQGERVSPALAASVGSGAALGFALKHYFLGIPVLLEAWLLLGQRRAWRPIRPETLAIAAVGTTYAAALLLFERDFLTTIVPLIQLAYGVFGAPSVKYLFGPFAIVGLTCWFAVASHAPLMRGGRAPFAEALLVAATGFAAIYFVQFKGWAYHTLPLIGCASLALAALLAEADRLPRLSTLVAPALLIAPLFLAYQEQRNPGLPGPDLQAAVADLKPGDTVGFLTTETAIPWSVTLQGGYRYASRYNGYWMMQAIVANESAGSPNPRLARLGRQIVGETVVDFTCTPPRRIIAWRPAPGQHAFDILPFFTRDPAFARLFAHYRLRSRTSVASYDLVSPLPAPTGACRNGV